MKTLVIGGGSAGTGAAGGVKAANPDNEVVVYTDFADIAYSPCGIPFVHGKEIESFERLFLATKEDYVKAGIDIHYNTTVSSVDVAAKTAQVVGEGTVSWDRLVIASGFKYADPGVPGGDLDGLYYVKNIREAAEWDKRLDSVKKAVVIEASPLGVEMISALAHRGIETHVVDPHPWSLSEIADPDIVAPVEQAWRDQGVTLHFNTRLEAFLGSGSVTGVRTSEGDIDCDLVVVATHKTPNNALAQAAGIKIGSTGGIIVGNDMSTSARDVWAAGDVIEVPHGQTKVPVQGLTGSHAYSQGKIAGYNAGGGRGGKVYSPVYVPWGMLAATEMIGGVALGETLAASLGIPHVLGVAQGISRARYYPGVRPVKVKLLADPASHKLIGAQMVGGEGIKERADFLAMCVRKGITLEDLATMENVYSPAIGALNEPISVAAQNALAGLAK
ncbi:MAG: FAD-dependent oxidoreductase [Nocardioides sp.]